MQTTIETLEGLKRRIQVAVPAEAIEKAITSELRNIAKTRRFDGFRKGKVPLPMVDKMYGQSVRQEKISELMQRQYIETIIKDKINPAGSPIFDPVENASTENELQFYATFEVYPVVELQSLDQIEVEQPVVNIEDTDIENMLNTLRKQQSTWKEVNKAVVNEMRITMDFTGTIDNEEFEGGKAEDFNLEIGQGRMIPGFEEAIIGKKVGDAFDINVTFPEDYQNEALKGKNAVFAAKLNKVEQPVLPELDDAFVEKFAAKDLDTLKGEIRKNIERESRQAVKNRVKEQILQGLVTKNPIDVPSALVDQEIEQLRNQAAQRFGGQADIAKNLPREIFESQAKQRVATGLLLGEFINVNKLEATDEKLDELLNEVSHAYEDPSEVVAHYKKDENIMKNLRNVALEEIAIETLLAQANATEKQVSFSELMDKK